MLTLRPLVPITLKPPRFPFNIPHHHVHFSLKLKTYAQNDSAKESSGGPVSNDDGNGPKKDRFSFRWAHLLNPDPDNFVAVGLAGVLTWASLQVLSQLFFISFAMLLSSILLSLRYSFSSSSLSSSFCSV